MRLCCSFRRIELFAAIVASVIIISTLIVLFLFNWPSYTRQRIIDAVQFRNGSMSMERFKSTADIKDLRLIVYVFNVTNPHEVENSSAKINLQEVGPFVYKELKTKNFLSNDQTAGLIKFQLRKLYTFDRSASIADPKDVFVTWPNVPLIVARSYLDNLGSLTRFLAYKIIESAIKTKNEKPFIRDSVANFLFDGSKRELFEYLQSMDKFKFLNPWPLKDNKFGILYGRNNTWDPKVDRTMTSSAGFGTNQTYHDLDQLREVNGTKTMDIWSKSPPTCNIPTGTSGEFFSPFLNKSQVLKVFSLDMCRSLDIIYRQDAYLHGIKSYLYELDQRSLLSPFRNPANKCYCLDIDAAGVPSLECQRDGLIDLANCAQPNVIASTAHFVNGSPSLRQRITGISEPNTSTDVVKIFVEPNTGLSLDVWVPIQFNVKLQKGGFNMFKFQQDNESLIIPLLIATEVSSMNEDQAAMLRGKLLLLDSWLVVMVLGGAIIFVGAILVSGTIICLRYRRSHLIELTRNSVPTETDPLLGSTTPRPGSSQCPSDISQ